MAKHQHQLQLAGSKIIVNKVTYCNKQLDSCLFFFSVLWQILSLTSWVWCSPLCYQQEVQTHTESSPWPYFQTLEYPHASLFSLLSQLFRPAQEPPYSPQWVINLFMLPFKNLYVFIWLHWIFIATCDMWHVGSSSLARDWTQVPCIGCAESLSLDHQGSAFMSFWSVCGIISFNIPTKFGIGIHSIFFWVAITYSLSKCPLYHILR